MAHSSVIDIDEQHRILVAVGYRSPYAVDYFPQEKRDGVWYWMEDAQGKTVCLTSEQAWRDYLAYGDEDG